ncbi:conserved hypothetical protein [Sporisorium reilianum SRZ2]|uniref:Transmembrane protein n=1 Tax=Sporisorium reilianum (strain SRZ2) TaxID=999809 RepID=E6ZPU3_SPORE|nr:conserved hypothetical protein [Sporisorium reilianum SRZ2]
MPNSTQLVDWLAKVCNGTTDLSSGSGYDLAAAGIILPPSFGHDQAFSNNVAIVAATLYCWEYLMTVPSEIGIYVTIPWRAPHLILFVLMRYTTLVAISLGLFATWHPQSGACIPYREICTLLVQLSVSAVLGWRTIAIWQRDARIIVIVFLLLTTLMLFSSLLVLSLKSRKLSNDTCLLVENGNYDFFPLAWFYAGTVLYDTIVIVLSTYRLWQHHNDVGAFPDADPKSEGKKSSLHWLQWIHAQWHSLTPLLFRLASNGVLYLGFSTVFNIVCFVVGHWDERRAQDLMLLYSSVMWIVCQRLVLLEVKATWRDRLSMDGLKQAGNEETDRLIARILQASWSSKPPPAMNGKMSTGDGARDKSKEQLVLSLSVDSCLKAAPTSCCACGPNSEAQSQRSRAWETRRTSGLGVELHDAEMGEARVQQLHDFRLSLPDGFFDDLGRTPAGSKTVDSTGGVGATNTCNDESDPESRMETGLKRRLGALRPTRSPHKLFATSPNKSPRSDTTLDTAASNAAASIDHPLLDSPSIIPAAPPAPEPSFRRTRRSHAFDARSKSTSSLTIPTHGCACSCARDDAPPRAEQRRSAPKVKPRAAVPSLEVADMLANMSDDAKTTALALAGMEGQPSLAGSEIPPPRAATQRPLWIIHPPL